MSNQSYSYSYSSYESIYRLVSLFCGEYETSLYAEVTQPDSDKGFENLPGQVTLKVLNFRTRTDSLGNTVKSEFPALLQVPVLNVFQNIKCPKLSEGQKGVVIFNKHYLPDQFSENTLEEIPSPKHIFNITDSLFIPLGVQDNPSPDTTTITSTNIDLEADKFSVSNGTYELIELLAEIIGIIGTVQYEPGDSTINAQPMFQETLLKILNFIKEKS